MIKNGEEVNKAFNVSSLYATLMAIFLYLGRIIPKGEIIYVMSLIYIITAWPVTHDKVPLVVPRYMCFGLKSLLCIFLYGNANYYNF